MMEAKTTTLVVLVLAVLAYCGNAQPAVFDITKYGAVAGADISQALLSAWKEAIASKTPSQVVIPAGTWSLTQVKLLGPALAPIELQNLGTVQANPDPAALPDKNAEWITVNYVNFFTLSGGGVFDGQGQKAWTMNDCAKNPKCPKLPINLSFNFINNSVIRDVTTKDSKNFHTNCISSMNVSFIRYTVSAPGDSPNTDGLHVARSNMVNITDSVIETGDDCISMGDQLTQVYIQNVTCGPGHGISIGSLGKNPDEKDISGIFVTNCTFIDTQNGIRIKTWPSAPGTLKISDIHFQDLIMKNASNPIIIDQQYCPSNQCDKSKPSLIQISGLTIKNVKGTASSTDAVTLSCSSGKPCEKVEMADVDLSFSGTDKSKPFGTFCENVKPTIVGVNKPPLCAAAAAAA